MDCHFYIFFKYSHVYIFLYVLRTYIRVFFSTLSSVFLHFLLLFILASCHCPLNHWHVTISCHQYLTISCHWYVTFHSNIFPIIAGASFRVLSISVWLDSSFLGLSSIKILPLCFIQILYYSHVIPFSVVDFPFRDSYWYFMLQVFDVFLILGNDQVQ